MAVAFALVFSALEIALRVFYPQELNFTQPDSYLGFSQIPDVHSQYLRKEFTHGVYINSKGLRDDERSYEKPDGVRRILMLGDSFTFGIGLKQNETIPGMLEHMLNSNRESPYSYEVINAGVGGYGTEQELIFLMREGLKYNPDIVLLSFYSNDPSDNLRHDLSVLQGNELVLKPLNSSVKLRKLRVYLSSHFHLYALFAKSLRGVKAGLEPGELGLANDGLYLKEPGSQIRLAWDETKGMLRKMIDVAASRNISFVVSILPGDHEVDGGALSRLLRKHSTDSGIINITMVPGELGFLDSAKGVFVFKPLPLLVAENKNHKLYYDVDRHLNPYGARFYAEKLFGFLNASGIVW
ncbi:SGNH/GDSL hydrolase family protein [Candidatus Woesearchaeota archaeon]|nr:SGNH/GDSL hydrolase family protein [Candidatus Woesearchaeota archaeon]